MNNKLNINSKLEELLKKVTENSLPQKFTEPHFGGADIQITNDPSLPNKPNKGSLTFVITKYADQLSWLLCQLRDIFYNANLVDYRNKYAFFGKLADAANLYQKKLKGDENGSDLLKAVVNEAIQILPDFVRGPYSKGSIL